MQFIRIGNFFKVTRITGPSHNLLGIEFGEPPHSSEDAVIETTPNASQDTPRLTATEVRRSVLIGVADANAEFGTAYVVRRIEFIARDSPPPETYRLLARCIVERLAKKQPFTDGSKS